MSVAADADPGNRVLCFLLVCGCKSRLPLYAKIMMKRGMETRTGQDIILSSRTCRWGLNGNTFTLPTPTTEPEHPPEGEDDATERRPTRMKMATDPFETT